jgi:hypothetical protein
VIQSYFDKIAKKRLERASEASIKKEEFDMI